MYDNLIQGLQILRQHDTTVGPVAEGDMVYAGPVGADVPEPDAMTLQGLGWYIDPGYGRWGIITSI